MNAGLGNLATLKAFVLPEAMVAQTTFDARMATIGRGAAAAFERFLNRQLAYAVADTFETPANKSYVSLPRFPLVEVIDIAERDTAQDEFASLGAVNEVALNISENSGLVEFGVITAPSSSRLRVTYTGGYWFETREPADMGYPSAQPAGSTALPEDLKEAWLLHCQKIFERTRALSTAGVKTDDAQTPFLPSTKMDEGIIAMLEPHRRFA